MEAALHTDMTLCVCACFCVRVSVCDLLSVINAGIVFLQVLQEKIKEWRGL